MSRPTKLQLLQEKAESGDPLSQARFGWRLYAGKQIPRNRNKGLLFLEKSALAGNVEARFHLAVIQIQRRDPEGISVLRSLAKSGFVPAAYELGMCHWRGWCVRKSFPRAHAYFRMAAEKGNLPAKVRLCRFVMYGDVKACLPYRALMIPKIFILAVTAFWRVAESSYDEVFIGTMK